MERKKLPSSASLDSLIEAAISQSEPSIPDTEVFESDVAAFLNHYKITDGSHLISGRVLYKLYKLWSYNKIKQTQFSVQLSLYIPRNKRYYLINKSSSELIADLSIAIKKRKPPSTRKRSNWEHFEAFKNAHSISSGENWIEDYIIYHFYDKWVYNRKKKKRISFTNLIQFLKICFENRRTKTGYVMKISHNFEQTSIENLRQAWKRKQKDPK